MFLASRSTSRLKWYKITVKTKCTYWNEAQRLQKKGTQIFDVVVMRDPTFWCTLPPRHTGRWSRRCGGPGGRPAPQVAPGSRPATGRGWHRAAPIHWLRHLVQTCSNSSLAPSHTWKQSCSRHWAPNRYDIFPHFKGVIPEYEIARVVKPCVVKLVINIHFMPGNSLSGYVTTTWIFAV